MLATDVAARGLGARASARALHGARLPLAQQALPADRNVEWPSPRFLSLPKQT